MLCLRYPCSSDQDPTLPGGTCTGTWNWFRERMYSISTATTNFGGSSWEEVKMVLGAAELQGAYTAFFLYSCPFALLNRPRAACLVLHKPPQILPHREHV